jgi:hypothetical protein
MTHAEIHNIGCIDFVRLGVRVGVQVGFTV